MESNAIVVLAGGIKQNTSGRWASTDLTEEDDRQGAPGGKLRVLAAAVLATKHPEAVVVASGGKGYDVPADAPEDRRPLAEMLRDELQTCDIPVSRIVLEANSNTTYQALQELENMVREHRWHHLMVVTNRYHLARLRAMIETKFPARTAIMQLVAAEDILIEADEERWKGVLAEAYASQWLARRIEKEEKGVAQIKEGTYQFK